jgi:hypothetical protein
MRTFIVFSLRAGLSRSSAGARGNKFTAVVLAASICVAYLPVGLARAQAAEHLAIAYSWEGYVARPGRGKSVDEAGSRAVAACEEDLRHLGGKHSGTCDVYTTNYGLPRVCIAFAMSRNSDKSIRYGHATSRAAASSEALEFCQNVASGCALLVAICPNY